MNRWIDAGHALLDAARTQERGPGIRGTIGDALFACALGHLDPVAVHAWIQRAIDDIEANGTEVSLHRGIAGLGLVIAMHRPEEEELLGYVDEVVAGRLDALPPASMQSGTAGLALYASLRTVSESGRALQAAIVERLRATALPSEAGVVWATPTGYASARGLEARGEPVVEPGMVHGVAGALVGLAALAVAGSEAAADLTRAGIAGGWSLARSAPNRFGRVLFGLDGSSETTEWEAPRWCVGDPGVLRALWVAARAVGDARSSERALNALLEDARNEARGASDRLGGRLDLCCGAAAVAQVYLRMHRETGEGVFRDASSALLARCSDGFDALEDISFPYGRMGVVLALLAAERDEDPGWDAMLGMSLPRAMAG
jgi:hypothetical protein